MTDANSWSGPMIAIRQLLLGGVDKNYSVDLRREDGRHRGLSIVTGPSQTGKSSVLRFVDYALGASRYPQHPEVRRRVRTCAVEADLNGRPHILERSTSDGPSSAAWVRDGGFGNSGDSAPPERKPISPPSDPASLSSLLLATCGLEGIELREAPTKADSATQQLSFRDLMWLCFIGDDRMGTRGLLFETEIPKRLKLRQVVDVIFDVQDALGVDLGARIRDHESRVAKLRAEIQSLETFLEEQGTSSAVELELSEQAVDRDIDSARRAIVTMDTQAKEATSYANTLRQNHTAAVNLTRATASAVRNVETQLARLDALEAQYAADLTRLEFLQELGILFDDLHVLTCPACMNDLQHPPHVDGGRCSLCGHTLSSDGHDGAALRLVTQQVSSDDLIDLKRETGSVKRRHSELRKYQAKLVGDLSALKHEYTQRIAVEESAAAELNERTRDAVSPMVHDRDAVTRELAVAQSRKTQLVSARRLWAGLEKRQTNLARLERNLKTLRQEVRAAGRAERPGRDQVVSALSQRFAAILEEFDYPRLSDPFLDSELRPSVRGIDFRDQSDGARTLISLAWCLAVFEHSWESDGKHPGFLMLDSPQRGLGRKDSVDPEFRDARLVDAVYRHIETWTDGAGSGSQVIVADNAAPADFAEHVAIAFTGRADQPPYGLIDDEFD